MTGHRLSVIIPAYNCASTLARALDALDRSELPRQEWELIVADDGSTDDTPAVATARADAVVRVPNGPRGPASARNLGAASARAPLLVFVDADVCVAPTTLTQFDALFRTRADVGAAFGAYDTSPDAPSVVSQYRNLLHHYVHSRNAGPATTFWAGCGAIRAEVFRAAGGFDAERYPRSSIEDIELGYRLSAAGVRILLCPEIQGTHLKAWTLRGGFVTDVRDRGIPWMRILLSRPKLASAGALNVRRSEQLLTALAPLGVLLVVVALIVGSKALAALGFGIIAAVVAVNAPLLVWFARRRGAWFTLRIVPLRLAYYILNAVSTASAVVLHARDRLR